MIPTATNPETLFILVDWQQDYDGRWFSGLCGRLTCGHFSSPCHRASSTWDFPDEPQKCRTCGEEVQFDLKLQAMLMAQREETPIDFNQGGLQNMDHAADDIPTEDQRILAIGD